MDTSVNSVENSMNLNDSLLLNKDENDLIDIKERIKIFKYELVKEINSQAAKFETNLENLMLKKKKIINNDNVESKKRVSREKVFKHRESILTDLFRISHIRTLRHIFISILIIICFQIIIFDLTHIGRVNLDFKLFYWVFEGFFETIFFVWLPMKLSVTTIVYSTLKYYAHKRLAIKSNKKIFDGAFFLIYLCFLSVLVIIPLFSVSNVSLACRMIILMEQVRLLMKTHAFVRSNISRVIERCNPSPKSDSDAPKPDIFPEFSKFIYFLFAPTLVYRDNYPKTSGPIKWRKVLYHFSEVAGCLIYTYCLFDRYCVPVFRSLRIKELGLVKYIELISISIMPGALIQMMVFFAFLHSWHNAFAEMLKFGDRQFYLDWWNSTSFNEYYRTWNTLVHDWLYNYIYIDLYSIFGRKYKMLAQFGVIAISGIVHEYILSFTFGFFYPVMFIMFAGFGFAVLFIPVSNANPGAWNIFVWTSLFTGIGIEICFFAVEWYARYDDQCPRRDHTIVDYLVPRSLLCSN